ncbi:MAG: hypothetical protein KatS3mg057_2090 [Herpetosiphonaceae bacterium]|nr:MAG: hypothetical protein KatS3mg057_2090 [Herpetosiphonaceae bacterium]
MSTLHDLPSEGISPSAEERELEAAQTRQLAEWAGRIAAHSRTLITHDFSVQLVRRFDVAARPGMQAASFAERFFQGQRRNLPAGELVLAPYAPPQRHISSARQGALEWGASATSAPQAASSPGMITADQMAKWLGLG